MINKEFTTHILNSQGLSKAVQIAEHFDGLLTKLFGLCPAGREFAVARTKLEEACFFAKKAMASDEINTD